LRYTVTIANVRLLSLLRSRIIEVSLVSSFEKIIYIDTIGNEVDEDYLFLEEIHDDS
jgi:hypothetical protein